MKKAISAFLALLMIVSFTACSQKPKEEFHPKQEFTYTPLTYDYLDIIFKGATWFCEYSFGSYHYEDDSVKKQISIKIQDKEYAPEYDNSEYTFKVSYPRHIYEDTEGNTFYLNDQGNCVEFYMAKENRDNLEGKTLSEKRCKRIATKFVKKYTDDLEDYTLESEYNEYFESYVFRFTKRVLDGKYATNDRAAVCVHKTGKIIFYWFNNFGMVKALKEPLFDEEKLDKAVRAKIEEIFKDCSNKEQLVHIYSDYEIIITKEGDLAAVCQIDTERRVYSDEEFVNGYYEVNEDGYAVIEKAYTALIIK